jgi:beta-N-acetylhexosaminidase
MGLTESKTSEMQDRVEEEKEEDTQKREAIKLHQQESKSAKVSEEKENRSAKQEEDSVAAGEETPGEKSAATHLKPPGTPRRNVIPQRWSSAENGHRAQKAVKKSALPAEAAQDTSINQQPPAEKTAETAEKASPDESEVPPGPGIILNAVDTPYLASLPVTDPDALSNEHIADIPTLAALPIASPDAQTSEQVPEAAVVQTSQDAHESEQNAEKRREQAAAKETWKLPATPPPAPAEQSHVPDLPTTPLPSTIPVKPSEPRGAGLTRGRALLLALLLGIVIINASITGFAQVFGPQGWGSAFNSSDPNSAANLLTQVAQRIRQHTPTPGTTGQATPPTQTPLQIVNTLLSSMTLDEKLGQMMMIQFTGPDYSLQLSTMISQYKVGAVLVFSANGNIVSKSQLKGLIAQMQQNAFLPLAVAIDQEGGTVDRLINLDGPQPAAATIGATNNPNVAYQQGIKDAQALSSYGFNLNLAPVVDVTNVYNSQLYGRTYGTNPTIVTEMASAYLRGLQKSGKVMGTLKHFPGLGDVSVDPHYRPPDLTRSLSGLNAIDWAPYRNLIKQGNVYAIMVTHEYVKALDSNVPSSLSPQVIGVLRNQMHYQGVIMTDSLTMDSIHNYYSYGQAAAMAVEAGDDLLMGPASPNDVGAMIDGIKKAISSGAISEKQIDDSVRRILMLKYEMGLLHL